MLDLTLPPTDPNSVAPFSDVESCQRWISQFQLTDIRLAHLRLSEKVYELNRSRLDAYQRFLIAEQLRETVDLLQNGYVSKIVGKPLPLSESESTLLEAVMTLWSDMVIGYARSLQACLDGDARLSGSLALICQRCLYYVGLQISQYTAISHQVDSRLWLRLHQFYQLAEDRGFALREIEFAADSCAAVYVRTILICRSNPYELSRAQLTSLSRWLDKWARMVTLTRAYRVAVEKPRVPEVNLALAWSDAGERFVRYLDVSELSKLLRVDLVLLSQGKTPAQLDLGTCQECGELLEHLHLHWCAGRPSRELERRSISHFAEVVFGLAALHFRLSGKAFAQPKQKADVRQGADIATFGHVVNRGKAAVVPVERWDIQDESRKGFRLFRKHDAACQRISFGMLVGVKPEDGGQTHPCTVRWLIVGLNGDINIGLKVLEGAAETVAMRATGINLTVSTEYVQAVLLHAAPGLPPRLLMPKGWFADRRVVEINDSRQATTLLKLESLTDRGLDYELATFKAI